jgi:hypothetical protein
MYSTCLFCKSQLGRNEALQGFPVGRRVAFDASRGRLWVVCRACERWNLSAIDERWEAMEECERLFRDTRMRTSTENIGLARLREGLELVRVGSPQRPEMAAWRYGDQFGRRRKRAMVVGGLAVGALGVIYTGGLAAGLGLGAFSWTAALVNRMVYGSPKAVVATAPGENGEPLSVRRSDIRRVRLQAVGDSRDWLLEIALRRNEIVYTGEEAVRVAAAILPAINRAGGNRRHVSGAVDFLEQAGGANATFQRAAALAPGRARRAIEKLPYEVRLALEMAAHEEAERRALEGELAELERAWHDAEEIAAISDNLLMPTSIDDWIRRLRGLHAPTAPRNSE